MFNVVIWGCTRAGYHQNGRVAKGQTVAQHHAPPLAPPLPRRRVQWLQERSPNGTPPRPLLLEIVSGGVGRALLWGLGIQGLGFMVYGLGFGV